MLGPVSTIKTMYTAIIRAHILQIGIEGCDIDLGWIYRADPCCKRKTDRHDQRAAQSRRQCNHCQQCKINLVVYFFGIRAIFHNVLRVQEGSTALSLAEYMKESAPQIPRVLTELDGKIYTSFIPCANMNMDVCVCVC